MCNNIRHKTNTNTNKHKTNTNTKQTQTNTNKHKTNMYSATPNTINEDSNEGTAMRIYPKNRFANTRRLILDQDSIPYIKDMLVNQTNTLLAKVDVEKIGRACETSTGATKRKRAEPSKTNAWAGNVPCSWQSSKKYAR